MESRRSSMIRVLDNNAAGYTHSCAIQVTYAYTLTTTNYLFLAFLQGHLAHLEGTWYRLFRFGGRQSQAGRSTLGTRTKSVSKSSINCSREIALTLNIKTGSCTFNLALFSIITSRAIQFLRSRQQTE